MTEQEIKNLVTKQRNYFLTGETLPVSRYRFAQVRQALLNLLDA